jgi:carboxyvinyl-carboxyphosphonate phosphorylmutase
MPTARERFRAVLARPAWTPAAPVFDPLSARIADMQGWEVFKLSGSVGKFANLAVPDGIPIANMSDLVDVCSRITRVSDASLIVDADDGGGNALTVMRTVRELEGAGVCAIEIEDNLVPARLAGGQKRHGVMVSKEEQVGKLRAALAARRDPATVIVARTSALSELPLAEAVDRIKAYSETGAQALMLLPGKPKQRCAELEAVSRVTSLPLCVHPMPAGEMTASEESAFMVAHNARIRFLGALTIYSMAVKAMHEGFEHLRRGGLPEELKAQQASTELMRAVDRTEEYRKHEQAFVRE